jgi:hypothetical protein
MTTTRPLRTLSALVASLALPGAAQAQATPAPASTPATAAPREAGFTERLSAVLARQGGLTADAVASRAEETVARGL